MSHLSDNRDAATVMTWVFGCLGAIVTMVGLASNKPAVLRAGAAGLGFALLCLLVSYLLSERMER